MTLLHKARAYAYEKYIYAISHIYIYISGLRGNTNTSAHTNITQTTNTPLSLTTRKRNKCTCRHEISAVLFPLGSQGGFQFEKHRTHITTCECVPQSLCDFSHSSNIWILTYSPSSASVTPFQKISRKYSPQDIPHLLCLCLQGKLSRKRSFGLEDLPGSRSMGLWPSTSA